MFNNYIWQLYLNAGGNLIVDKFKTLVEDVTNTNNESVKHYPELIKKLHKSFCPSKYLNDSLKKQLQKLIEDINLDNLPYPCDAYFDHPDKAYDFNGFLEVFYNRIKNEEQLADKDIFECFSDGLYYFTTFFFCLIPDLFIPYYFKCNFNILEKIANEFDISIPTIPVKKDYKNRFFYYAEICSALYDFRVSNNLSPYELCAFLYDFAPKYVGGIDSYIIEDLPPAKSSYFIGGNRNDLFLSNEEDTITPWQCNPDTQVGDNIVMYIKSPISAIDSIWRSVSIGFNDPFFYYYRCTYISKPHKINKITQKQLESDSVFSNLPIVRKNMQGINGVELYSSVYNHLLDISESQLPRLEYLASDTDSNIKREKDVENKLIKPFLKKLGYNENDYVQQLYIEIGNHNHALIPDFVILPKVGKGHYSAMFLIEAKYTVRSQKDLEEYKKQARSYANQLKAKYSVLASKEGIWISSNADDYSNDFIVFSWNELKNDDNFYAVLKTLGNK